MSKGFEKENFDAAFTPKLIGLMDVLSGTGLLVTCLHDPTKIQLKAVNRGDFHAEAERIGL